MSELTRKQVVALTFDKTILAHDAAQRAHLATQGEEIERLKEQVNKVTKSALYFLDTCDEHTKEILAMGLPEFREKAPQSCQWCDVKQVATLQAELEVWKQSAEAHRSQHDTLTQQLAQVTKERDRLVNPLEHADYFVPRLIQLEERYTKDQNTGQMMLGDSQRRVKELEQQLAAREGQVKGLEEALKEIAEPSQIELWRAMQTGDLLKVLAAALRLANDLRDRAQHALKPSA